MNARQWLTETHAHMPPTAVLAQLGPADAERHLPGVPHSIADIVAHMSFWQEWLCLRCDGMGQAMPASAADGWPEVIPGAWPTVLARFTAGLARAESLGARAEQAITPPIEFPPLAGYSVQDAVIHIAQHNSHHLGQVVVLRQLLGRWPPPSGSWTW
jgi:uncharacterized damage-inducible protein DinB